MNSTNHFNCRTIGSYDLETKLLSEPFHPLFPPNSKYLPYPSRPGTHSTRTHITNFNMSVSHLLEFFCQFHPLCPPNTPNFHQNLFTHCCSQTSTTSHTPVNNTVKTTSSLTLRGNISNTVIFKWASHWLIIGRSHYLIVDQWDAPESVTDAYIHTWRSQLNGPAA